MSLLCKHVDVSGADLVRLLVRAQERREKMAKFQQEVEKPEPPKKTLLDQLVKWIGLGAVLGFTLLVLVQVAKGLVR